MDITEQIEILKRKLNESGVDSAIMVLRTIDLANNKFARLTLQLEK